MNALDAFASDAPSDADLAFQTRMFVMSDGASHKFWASLVRDDVYIAWWGRIGTDGQCKAKRMGSAVTAVCTANQTASSKLDKGYYGTWSGTINLPAMFLLMLDDDSANVIPPANLSEALLAAAPHDPRGQ